MKVKAKTDKSFDCVAFVREQRLKIAKETEGKSPEEILAYFKRTKKNS